MKRGSATLFVLTSRGLLVRKIIRKKSACLADDCLQLQILATNVGCRRPFREGRKNQNQKSSCINDTVGEVFEVMTDLKYSAFSIRAAEIRGPTVTAIPASRRAATPRPLTRGLGSVMQHTTICT